MSHLSVILDLSPTQWARATPSLDLRAFIAQTLAFLNSHIACSHENSLAVFGAFPGKSALLYASSEDNDAHQASDADGAASNPDVDANAYQPFKTLEVAVMRNIHSHMESLQSLPDEEPPVAIVGALIKALCFINRLNQPQGRIKTDTATTESRDQSRILILSVSRDLAASYIPLMNAIFSAQKLKILIDVCKLLSDPETVFLQQAAHLTGGSYIALGGTPHEEALLQHLMMCFLAPPAVRRVLACPTQGGVDFRAACFCHKEAVDVAFVCSVCLSIFCKPLPVCSTCRTRFPMKTLQRLAAIAKPTVLAATSRVPSHSGAPTPSATPVATNGNMAASLR